MSHCWGCTFPLSLKELLVSLQSLSSDKHHLKRDKSSRFQLWAADLFLRACPAPWLGQGEWGEALGWSLCLFGLMQVIQGCTCSLQFSPGAFPFPAVCQQDRSSCCHLSLGPGYQRLWLAGAPLQQCWKAALADGHHSLVQFQLMASDWMLWMRDARASYSSCWQRVQPQLTSVAAS